MAHGYALQTACLVLIHILLLTTAVNGIDNRGAKKSIVRKEKQTAQATPTLQAKAIQDSSSKISSFAQVRANGDFVSNASIRGNKIKEGNQWITKGYCKACQMKNKGKRYWKAERQCNHYYHSWTFRNIDITNDHIQTNGNRRRNGRRRNTCYRPTERTMPDGGSRRRGDTPKETFERWIQTYDADFVCQCLALWDNECSASFNGKADCYRRKICSCPGVCKSFKKDWGCGQGLLQSIDEAENISTAQSLADLSSRAGMADADLSDHDDVSNGLDSSLAAKCNR